MPIAVHKALMLEPSLWLISKQAMAPDIDTTDPTERSIPLVAITIVIPIEIRTSGAARFNISIKLPYKWPSFIVIDKKSCL
ncbi:hypothetical protein LJK88_43355 [Paenibacillus sp. P26]|nr:hypothetical protein LJK88_43355 [Paenibacillus sp. P26]UUZ92429.1 hypothetical protein LJK87_44925 [Paenibacillus sp. P25]